MQPPFPPGRRRLTRRLSATAIAALFGVVTTAAPASAVVPETTSVWGYSGLVLMPTAGVHGFRDFSVGGHLLTKGSQFTLVPYATAGVFEGLEFGILYGVPVEGFSGLSGHAKYQLIRPTRDRPTAVAVGLSLLGVNTTDPTMQSSYRYVDGNNVYLVLSHDINTTIGGATYTLASAHFGFAGNLTLGSRMMAGLEVPIADKGSVVADYMGPMGAVGGFFNLGASYKLSPEIKLRAFTMGVPGAPLTDRDFGIGMSYSGNLLGNLQGAVETPGPQATPTPRPWTPTPAPTPGVIATPAPLPSIPPTPAVSPTPEVTPTPTPVEGPATVRGTLLDDKGRPLAGWQVGAPGADRWTPTDVTGRYSLTLPLGPYELTVKDPAGKVHLTKPIRLVTPKGMELPLVVAVPVGQLKGMVVDASSRQGLADTKVQLFRAGETYNLSTRDSGAFYVSDLPAGQYRVVVTRSRYQAHEETVQIQAKQERSVVVQLKAKPGSLAGKVTTLTGQGLPGVVVTIPSQKKTTTTDRLGAYDFPELPPGEHEVVYTQGARRVSTTLVRVRSDETTTENVTVAPEVSQPNRAGTISGQIVDAATRRPIGGVKIVVEGGELTVLTITASDGRFTVGDLPPGRYKVTASRAGYKPKQAAASVTAKAGASVNVGLSQNK